MNLVMEILDKRRRKIYFGVKNEFSYYLAQCTLDKFVLKQDNKLRQSNDR